MFPNLFYPSACQQQNVAALNETFYSKDWVNYTTCVASVSHSSFAMHAVYNNTWLVSHTKFSSSLLFLVLTVD